MTSNPIHTDYPLSADTPKISVVVPAYNVENLIEKCLNSLFSQTFKDFEVIVVNDGSTDHTCEICEKYASLHTNMTVINQKNEGIAKARNEGLKVCKGEYITFSDSDDYMEPNWLQCFMDTINSNNNCDMVVQGVIVDYPNKKDTIHIEDMEYNDNNTLTAYLKLKHLHIEGFIFNKIYKRSIISDNHIFFYYELKEDLLFNLKYLYFTSSIITISITNYHYVQHGSQSLSHKRYPADYMEKLINDLYFQYLQLCEKYHSNDLKNAATEEYIISFAVLLFSMYQGTNRIIDKVERINYIKAYQQIRKNNKNIKIKTGNEAKRLFAWLMMLPPNMADTIAYVLIL